MLHFFHSEMIALTFSMFNIMSLINQTYFDVFTILHWFLFILYENVSHSQSMLNLTNCLDLLAWDCGGG